MSKDFDTLSTEIGLVVSGILRTDLELLRGYSRAKARAIASFTVLLGEAQAAGGFSSEQMAREMEELERMVVRFVRNIRALAATTAERLLRGIGELLLGTLRQVTGLPALSPVGLIWGVGAG